MSVHWNKRAVRQIKSEAMKGLAAQGRSRLRTLTCATHGVTHPVAWNVKDDKISVTVEDPCCDELQAMLEAETERAIQ
jgi:hypothetical protein